MKQLIDNQWLFRKDDGSFSDFGKFPARTLDLPHDWCIEEGAFAKENYIPSVREEGHLEFRHDSYLPRGCGMYQKRLEIPQLFENQRVFLEFDGVFGESTLFVDGIKAGENSSGYTGAVYDITSFAAGKKEVTLEMHVSAERMQGWWYEGGGIYRHVWLIIKPDTHLVPWGIAITTPEISESSAKIHVEAEIANAAAGSELLVEILDPASGSGSKLLSQADFSKECIDFTIDSPRLWDIDSPHCYTARITLKNGADADVEYLSFGIRHFEFTPDKGFFLNGRHLQLRGGNIHHDFGGLGTALPDRAHEKNVEVLKEMGANMIRSSHNPAAPALMEACDRMGMLLWAETRNLHTDKGAEKDLTDLIRRDRNHPSVILWSLANTAGGQEGNRNLTTMLKTLHDLAKQLDPTRPTAVGLEGNADANANGFADTVDVVGYNGGGMGGKDVRDHENYPERCEVISEYSSGRGARGIYKEEEFGESGIFEILGDGRKLAKNGKYCSELALLQSHAREWEHVMEHPYLAGGLMWSAIEYRGETCGFPVVTSQFGVLDICRFPKDTYYYYQMLWGKKPMIHIFPPWNRDVPAGTPVELYCCSNCDSVTLELNGKVIMENETLPGNKYAVWEIPYEPGTLIIRGKKEGKEVCSKKLVTPGKAAALTLTSDNNIPVPGGDIAFLRMDVVDEKGNFVPDAAVDLEITVTGAGTLAGVCSGDPASHERENTPFIRTFSGSALAIIKSSAEPGKITVTVKGKELQSAKCIIESLISPTETQR
ncbi:MAG: DUF4982 domain-containing protein [Lentisphaeria bacterium]|nr:DUF4982 domain-containing protein [Lentisphaeria bacterium]